MTTIPIFLSSTFRDFHRERDILVHDIVPQLNDALREFGCRVDMVDLRWGVGGDVMDKDDETKHARVLSVCFDEIERSRPLFVGLAGYRYGWVPPPIVASSVVNDRLTTEVAGMSLAALEFEFGAFREAARNNPTVFFVRDIDGEPPVGFRDPDVTSVNALRARISDAASSNPHWSVSHYALTASAAQIADYQPFTDLATRVLIEAVVARARSLPDRPQDPIDAAEQLFFESRVIVEGREALIRHAADLLSSARSVCLLGESGVGKSAIWCKVVDAISKDCLVLRAAVASSELLTTNSEVVRRLASQLGIHPPRADGEHTLLDWWRDQMRDRDRCVVAIDGIDSLGPGSTRDGLGCVFGVSATHLVSTTDVAQAGLLRANGFEVLEVGPLSPRATSVAASALVRDLQRTLPPRAIELLASRPRSPLWLRLALGEVAALSEEDFNSIYTLDDPLQAVGVLVEQVIAQLPVELPEMIQRQVSRAESQLGVNVANAILCGLALSRSGLSPVDLTAAMAVTELDVAVVRRTFGGLIHERGLDGRLGYAHSAVKNAIESTHPLSDYTYRQELHWRISKVLRANGRGDSVRHADTLWHALSTDSEEAAAFLGDVMLVGLGAGPVDLPEYVVRVVAASLRTHGVRSDVIQAMSEKVVRGVARAMSRGAIRSVPAPVMRDLAVGLLDRARQQVQHPRHNADIANMAVASALRAAVRFNPDEVRSYVDELEAFLAISSSGRDEVYLAFSNAAQLIDPDAGRALISRAVVWAELAVANAGRIMKKADPPDSSTLFEIYHAGWSNLCIALEAAFHLQVADEAPPQILRYCELLYLSDPDSRLKRRNLAAARILAAAAHVAPPSARDTAIADLEELLVSEPEDEESLRLLDCAIRSSELSTSENRQLLMPIDDWPRCFTEDEALAHAISQEAVKISLVRINRGANSADQLLKLSQRLCALTEYSCEPDPGERMSQSLSWLERAVAQDPSVVTSASLRGFDHLDTAVFATTTHLRTLVRIVRATGRGWVATLIRMLRSTSLRLVQRGETKEGAELLLEAADLLRAWEHSRLFEEERESGRKFGGDRTRPKYCGLIANDLRRVRGRLTWRHVKLVGPITKTISDLDRIAGSGR